MKRRQRVNRRRGKAKAQKRRHFELRISRKWAALLPKITHEDEIGGWRREMWDLR
jgi:hypothetical protein